VTSVSSLSEIDFTDLDHFASGFPHDLFAVHRREAPVYWHQPSEHTPDGEGFWSVATYAETLAVLRDPQTYSSVTGGSRPYGGTLLQDLAIAGHVLNMMDDPRHSKIRRLVSSGLTPRMIARVEDDLRSRGRRLLDSVEPGVPFDFLVDIAAELPMQMICILLGVPESERHWLFHASSRSLISAARARRPSGRCPPRRPARGCTPTARN
jgi:cytochrome P450